MGTQTIDNAKTKTRTRPEAPLRAFLGQGPNSIERRYPSRPYSNLQALHELLNSKEQQHSVQSTAGEHIEASFATRVLGQAQERLHSEWADSLLWERNIRVPVAVLTPFFRKPGRPNKTEAMYRAWTAKGRPETTWELCEELAKRFYADEFTQAKSDPKVRKKLRDRVGAAIRRHERTRCATKLRVISSRD